MPSEDRFMKLGEALLIVYELADGNKIDLEGVFPELDNEAKRQQLALDVVADFIVNNFGE